MIYWIPLILLVVVAFLILKFKEVRHRMGLIVILGVLLFFVVTYGTLYSTHKADLKTFDGNLAMLKVYFSWLGEVFKNVGHISAYAIKQDWGVNITNSTIK